MFIAHTVFHRHRVSLGTGLGRARRVPAYLRACRDLVVAETPANGRVLAHASAYDLQFPLSVPFLD